MFKKITAAILLTILLYSLAGCIPVTLDEYYEISQETNQIQSIALYERDDSPGATINALKITPLAEISTEDFSSFVSELEMIYSKTGFYITIAAQDPSFYFDKYVVQIKYKNGNQEFVSDGGFQEIRDKNGKGIGASHYSFDDTQWANFLAKYFSVS